MSYITWGPGDRRTSGRGGASKGLDGGRITAGTADILLYSCRVVVSIIRLDFFHRCREIFACIGNQQWPGVEKTACAGERCNVCNNDNKWARPMHLYSFIKKLRRFSLLGPSDTSRTRGAHGLATKTVFIVN